MRGALSLVVAAAVAAVMLTSKAEGAPSKASEKPEVILSVPSAPLDERRIEQALNRLKEELGKPSTSAEDSGFDGEDLSTHRIKTLLQKEAGEKPLSGPNSQGSAKASENPIDRMDPIDPDGPKDQKEPKDSAREDGEQKTSASEIHLETQVKELTPFQIPPMSYLKKSVGDDDHEFFFEEPRRNSFHGASFRDVFDDAEEKNDDDEDEDDDDDDDSSDDTVFRSSESRRTNSKHTDKGSRSEDDGYLVEPDSVVAEIVEKYQDSEKIVPEKDVMHVVDDELLRPKEVHKYSDGSSFDLHTPELLADLQSSSDISLNSSDLVPTQLIDGDTLSSLNDADLATNLPEIPQLLLSAIELVPPVSSAAPSTSTAIPTTTGPPETTERFNDPVGTVSKDASALSPVTSAKTATEVPPAVTTETIRTITTEKPAPVTTTTAKPTTAAPSTVQKIPQFIKSIYEAATQKLPSFIHAQGVDAGLIAPPKQLLSDKNASTSSGSKASGSSGSGSKTSGTTGSGIQSSGSSGSGNQTSDSPGSESQSSGSSGAGSKTSGSSGSGTRTSGSSGPGTKTSGSSGPGTETSGSSDPGVGATGSEVPGSSSTGSEPTTTSIPSGLAAVGEESQTEQHAQGGPGQHSQGPEGSPLPNSQVQTRQLAVEICLFQRLCLQSPSFLEVRPSQTAKIRDGLVELEEVSDQGDEEGAGGDDEEDDEVDNRDNSLRDRVGDDVSASTTTSKPRLSQTPGSVTVAATTAVPDPLSHSSPNGWSSEDLAFLQQLMKLDSHGSSGSVSQTAPPSGGINTTVSVPPPRSNNTTPEPVQENQSTTSSPQDTPIGTLVKGKACEGQTMSKLDRIIEHFPARLPELHEFKRRRFLRAAVIGGLHTLRSTQRNVTCNLTSKTTYWGYKLRGQLDGILNLGITGLPRMYLRYTGPLTIKLMMTAIGNETKPYVDSVTVEESRVDEIHYQSVLGFEQPFVERATKYLLQRAMKEEIVDPITNALMDEIENPKPDRSKVLLLDDLKNQRKF